MAFEAERVPVGDIAFLTQSGALGGSPLSRVHRLGELLRERCGIAAVRVWERPAASVPAGDAVYRNRLAVCGAAIVGVGD